jgi:RNA polymerase sigma factor (sigma-70 family)
MVSDPDSSPDTETGAALMERVSTEVLRQRGVPLRMDDAATNKGILLPRRPEAGSRAKWLYYEHPVRNYLKGLGCPEQDIDDLTHEVLIRLNGCIVDKYDPSRPFRPYFKAAIRNCYFKHLRARSRAANAAEEEAEAPNEPESGSLLLQALPEYARQVYECFTESVDPQLAPGVRMLHSWIILGAKQEQLAQAWRMTARQVRTHIARAADALADWMQLKINPEDLEDLEILAHTQGVRCELGLANVRGLFSHLSKRKRLRVLLILAIIYRKMTSAPPGSS